MALDDPESFVNQKFIEVLCCSIYWQHVVPISRVQKAKVNQERLFTG
jgi:hypothetical protein